MSRWCSSWQTVQFFQYLACIGQDLFDLFRGVIPVEHFGIVNCAVARLGHFAGAARAIIGQNALLDRNRDHVMDGSIGFALGIDDFLQRTFQNGAAEDRTGQVKTINLTAMRLFKKKLDSAVRCDLQTDAVQRRSPGNNSIQLLENLF